MRRKEFRSLEERILSIVIIGVDHSKRSINEIFAAENGMSRPPRFNSPIRDRKRNIRYLLINIGNADAKRSVYRLYPVADDGMEVLFNIMPENDNN